MFTPEQIKQLEAPLNAANVKKNPKGHDYVEGWHAIAEANRIFGHDGWAREVVNLERVAEPYKTGENWRVGYRATVRITVYGESRNVIRDGTGYGSGIVRDLNDAHEGAVKEAETDAMKRALMTFGNPFGLALYDKQKANVVADAPTDPAARAAMTAHMTEITMATTRAELTAWKNNTEHQLSAMPAGPDYDTILAHFKTRWNALAPTKPQDDPFRSGGGQAVAGDGHNGARAN